MLVDDTFNMPSNKPRITIRVSQEELDELQKAADEEYRTVPSLVLTLVKKFLDERRASTEPPKKMTDQPN